MRADIHDESGATKSSSQRPDTLMQDRICQIDENLLHPTAGPYIWVKLRRTQCEHMFSASPSKPDIARCGRHVSMGPRVCENALFEVIRAIRFPAIWRDI
jgi:hypothetical protein